MGIQFRWWEKGCGLSSVQSLIGLPVSEGRKALGQAPMVTMGLPRMGTMPGTSNKPPGMRQETVSSQTQRASLFSHQGIPHVGLQPQDLPVAEG